MSFASAKEVFASVTRRVNGEIAFFLDLDGTLIDFADKPDDVIIPDDLEDTLTQLSTDRNVVIVTGRDVDFVDRVFPNLKPACATSHGAEIRYSAGGDMQPIVPVVDTDDLNVELLTQLKANPQFVNSGVWIEKKKYACAIHWRNCDLDDATAESMAREAAEQVVKLYNSRVDEDAHLATTAGDMVIEVRPVGATKEHAIAKFMEQPQFANVTSVFYEDSAAGLKGMQLVQQKGGLGIAVGDNLKDHADLAVSSPSEARRTISLFTTDLRK